MSGRRHRVAIVAPMIARHDAISMAAVDSLQILSSRAGWDVSLLTNWSDVTTNSVQVVPGVAMLLKCESFRSADAVLYHFGVYHPFFDALIVGNATARQIVRFHNVTPPEFVP